MIEYNNDRVHSGKYCYGKTPKQTFDETKYLVLEKMLDKNYLTDKMSEKEGVSV